MSAPSCVWGPYAWRRCRHPPRSRKPSRKPQKRVPESRRHFLKRVDKALDNRSLQQALTSGLTGIRARRDLAFESFVFEKGRAELKQRRRANLDDLPELADRFKQMLEAAGGLV